MALSLLAANNAQTVLVAGISSTATSLTVNTGTGTLFPSPVTGTSFFKLTIIDAATGSLTEIVHVTARNGDVFTIQRGQEGTVARAWSANDIAANMMTAGTLSYILGNFQPLDPTLTALAALVGVANKLPYFNGDDTAALTDLTQVGRDIIGKSTIADILTYLGLSGFVDKSANLTALATLVGAANKLPYFNGVDSAALTDLTAVGRDIIGKSTIADILTYLGLSDVLHKGDGRLLSGTYVSNAEDKKSIGLRASTGCQFMRAYQAPDAPSQTAYWNVVVMPESTVAGNPVSCIAISVSDIYVGNGTSAGITTWVRLSSDNAAPPIGIPFYWPLAALPDSVVPEWAGMTFLKMNGATFSATQYPKLAKVWPRLSLPETRGEFIRVADDGRGVNPGRAALSYEDDMFKSHSHYLYRSASLLQTGSIASDVGSQYQSAGLTGYVTADSGGSETRPRNIAFYFIVRAK